MFHFYEYLTINWIRIAPEDVRVDGMLSPFSTSYLKIIDKSKLFVNIYNKEYALNDIFQFNMYAKYQLAIPAGLIQY